MFKKRVNPYYNPEKKHHRQYGFENTPPTKIGFSDLLKWTRDRRRKKLPKPPTDGYLAFNERYVIPLQFPKDNRTSLTWLGHSSVYIRSTEVAMVTDPVFLDRVSPVSFVGPTRKISSANTADLIPKLDFILISYNHYDHLDEATILALFRQFPNVTVIVPLGLKAWFKKRGMHNVVELDWWDQQCFSQYESILNITAVPAQHWSKRGLWDRNCTLWCGYVIEIADKTIYFAGDTGFTPQLKEIGERFSIDVGLIPIGAYEPRWLMGPQHISPKEAVEIHHMLQIKQSIGIHWGVFELTDEALDEPPKYLKEILREQNCDDNTFITLLINESLKL